MRFGAFTLGLLVIASSVFAPGLLAQKQDPVQWTLTAEISKAPPGTLVPLKLTATIQPGWHIYAPTVPKVLGGPVPTTVAIAANPAVASFQIYQPPPERKLDKTINLDTEMFENSASLWVPVQLAKDAAAGEVALIAEVKYAACDDRLCLPPKTKKPTVTIAVDPTAQLAAAFVVPAGFADIGNPIEVQKQQAANKSSSSGSVSASEEGWLGFALIAFGAGLAAIFTPCVFPMIPITVSFFLNQKGGLLQAAVFAFGIIALFSGLGLGLTALLGPFGVTQMSANPWVNAFIALVFGVFALSLLGAFEIALPSSLLTKMDGASRRGGYFGTLLMGLTFSLTSFACVGPFVGPLLASSAQVSPMQPVIGMASFATGLASPFFFLAAFPGYLAKLPRSGGWLMRVKVVMGFVLLAVMFKYLSTIDQVLQTGYLTRERFLAAWFVLFVMAGLYLLGLIRLEGVEPGAPLGVGRLLTGSSFLIFAFSLLPGMFGAPLGELDAFVPVASQNVSFGGATRNSGPEWMKDQLEQALDLGRQENKLILVNFTGYACTNCHWMKANMFPKPEIAAALGEFIRVELYTDGGDATSEVNQKLEDEKFQTIANPFYVLMDSDRNVIKTFAGSTRDPQEYLAFLNAGKRPATQAATQPII